MRRRGMSDRDELDAHQGEKHRERSLLPEFELPAWRRRAGLAGAGPVRAPGETRRGVVGAPTRADQEGLGPVQSSANLGGRVR